MGLLSKFSLRFELINEHVHLSSQIANRANIKIKEMIYACPSQMFPKTVSYKNKTFEILQRNHPDGLFLFGHLHTHEFIIYNVLDQIWLRSSVKEACLQEIPDTE